MSRLTDLLRQVREADPQLGRDLTEEFAAIAKRRTFGLAFEKHEPEAVELPGRTVRRGDKVRVLPARGESPDRNGADRRLWAVARVERTEDGTLAHLVSIGADDPDTAVVPVDDLVVVAEFRDRIYPGLVETGRVENAGPEEPYHSVLNAENHHALEMLTYTHRNSVDCIYIDPPYNTGAKDWKYNNDYVASDDDYRHSKWLSFMERRLKLAKELLNPENSVLIVTIDEKEYLRLGLLLEQTFPEARVQMVSALTNPKGVSRGGFRRADEYLFFVMLGHAVPARLPLSKEWSPSPRTAYADDVSANDALNAEAGRTTANDAQREPAWSSMMRRGSNSSRKDRPTMFYPIYTDPQGNKILHVGEPLQDGEHEAPTLEGLVAILPLRRNGDEGRWQVGADELRNRIGQGRVRLGRRTPYGFVVNYLSDGAYGEILSGRYVVGGRAADGSLIAWSVPQFTEDDRVAPTQWKVTSHNASEYGSTLLSNFIPGRAFPFPKSLYAVEDAVRFFVSDRPEATILDFFSGSGTTAHAVMRLNKQDGGRRRSISVTNNEASADEQKTLHSKGLRPGDPEWEALGICDYITKPRITAAITGKTPAGEPVKGNYKFTDEFPMAEGFAANTAFFALTYEDPRYVRHNRAFSRVAPMLWLRAGSRGRLISDLGEHGWDVAECYGVCEDMDQLREFCKTVTGTEGVETVFIVTDSSPAFQLACRSLPEHVTAIRLYESYLHNFEITRRAVS